MSDTKKWFEYYTKERWYINLLPKICWFVKYIMPQIAIVLLFISGLSSGFHLNWNLTPIEYIEIILYNVHIGMTIALIVSSTILVMGINSLPANQVIKKRTIFFFYFLFAFIILFSILMFILCIVDLIDSMKIIGEDYQFVLILISLIISLSLGIIFLFISNVFISISEIEIEFKEDIITNEQEKD